MIAPPTFAICILMEARKSVPDNVVSVCPWLSAFEDSACQTSCAAFTPWRGGGGEKEREGDRERERRTERGREERESASARERTHSW